jgi:hypothetical protein
MNTYRPPPQISPEARSKAVLEVQLRLERGEPPEECFQFLVDKGMPRSDARSLIDNWVRETVTQRRRRNVGIAVAAGAFLLLVSPLLVTTFLTSYEWARGKLFLTLLYSVALLIFGVAYGTLREWIRSFLEPPDEEP